MEFDEIKNTKKKVDGIKAHELKHEMQNIMQNYAAVFREEKTLKLGQELIDKSFQKYKNVKISDDSEIFNVNLVDALELRNLLSQAVLTLHSALARKESR
jgi:succinate dehydrogenase/fumarate reductase flavoprotein subunit